MEVQSEIDGNSKRKLRKTVLDSFAKLTNVHENVRIKSSTNLIKWFVENAQTQEGVTELNYALKRLVRGLGSPTLRAKSAYFATLITLLNTNLDIGFDKISECIKTELHKSGKANDGEKADVCSGQILACGALIKSSLWANLGQDPKEEVIKMILTACKERTYLTIFGYTFLIELMNIDPEVIQCITFTNHLKEEVAKPWQNQSLDSLHLLLTLKVKAPKIITRKFLKTFLDTQEVLCEQNLCHVCKILMTLPRVTSLKHPIYEAIPALLNAELLPAFFNELDTHLKTPNRNRLLAFIKTLTNVLLQISGKQNCFEVVPAMFTSNFITQLLGYFRTLKAKQSDKDFCIAVQKLFDTVTELCSKTSGYSDVKIAIIKKMLFDPGTFVFEKVTKCKIVQQITHTLDSEGVKKLAEVYKRVTDDTEQMNSENSTGTWLNNDRLYSAHLLIKLLSLPTMKEESDWKVDQLVFLIDISLLTEQRGMRVGRELANSLKTALFGALDLKLSKLEEMQTILSKLMAHLDVKINEENLKDILRHPVSTETYDLWKKTIEISRKIEKKQKKRKVTSVFHTLFMHMALQLFNEVTLATESLNELFSCYDRVKNGDNKLAVESEDDPLWIEVIVDLFLNLLSHNSHLLRSVIKSVFPHLCSYLNSSAIHQILSIFNSEYDESAISKIEDDQSDSETESEKAGDKESSSEESDSENEEDDEISDTDETLNDKLRTALHHALSNGTGHNSDDESIDLDQLSDTEGERLNQALGEAFKQFKPNKGRRKKQTKREETLTHFRVRVLDLIEIYLDGNPSMLLALEIMLPLLQALEYNIRDEHQKPLNDRLKNILKKLLKLRKFSCLEGVNEELLRDLLKSLLDKKNKNILVVQEIGEQIANCCVFIVKCSEILRGQEDTLAKTKKRLKNYILEVISGELYEFITKRNCLTPYVLFKSLMQISWEGNIGLAVILLDSLFNEDIRQFKKTQIAELLKIFYQNQRFLNQHKAKVDKKLKEAHSQFASNVTRLSTETNGAHVKKKYISNLFSLLKTINRRTLDDNSTAAVSHDTKVMNPGEQEERKSEPEEAQEDTTLNKHEMSIDVEEEEGPKRIKRKNGEALNRRSKKVKVNGM